MIAGIILAAGASSRMGLAKQLLQYKGESLLERAVGITNEAGLTPIIVVVGARAEMIGRVVDQTKATAVFNPDWETGMGSSVATGLKMALQLSPQLEAACFLLTDQPHVNSELVRQMMSKARNSDKLGVVSSYEGTLGVPALFKKELFTELLNLAGSKGAKPLIKKYAPLLESIDFPEGRIDLDHPSDWEAFKKGSTS
ncbi:MAG: nucleotidyltransferase family protein [Chitinophagales bacterium]|nr:nucleotidyltransferase family protein [Chitinophagales bacterium]